MEASSYLRINVTMKCERCRLPSIWYHPRSKHFHSGSLVEGSRPQGRGEGHGESDLRSVCRAPNGFATMVLPNE
eukprot:scaffold176102_cov36-Tisochrysis_lutea.AAC.3